MITGVEIRSAVSFRTSDKRRLGEQEFTGLIGENVKQKKVFYLRQPKRMVHVYKVEAYSEEEALKNIGEAEQLSSENEMDMGPIEVSEAESVKICAVCRMSVSEHDRIILGNKLGCRGYYFETNRETRKRKNTFKGKRTPATRAGRKKRSSSV